MWEYTTTTTAYYTNNYNLYLFTLGEFEPIKIILPTLEKEKSYEQHNLEV